MYKKTIIASSFVLIMLALGLSPISAGSLRQGLIIQETKAIENFMDEIEQIASESITFYEFAQKLQQLCQDKENARFPIIRELTTKILQNLLQKNGISIAGIDVIDLLGKLSLKLRPNYFVISFGAYKRLNPRKDNSISRFKEGLSMWRYSNTAKILKGRTLILERKPFGIHQKMIGPQIGIMKGFKGIYIDIESTLTSNAYVIFIGNVHRIRAFNFTAFSR